MNLALLLAVGVSSVAPDLGEVDSHPSSLDVGASFVLVAPLHLGLHELAHYSVARSHTSGVSMGFGRDPGYGWGAWTRTYGPIAPSTARQIMAAPYVLDLSLLLTLPVTMNRGTKTARAFQRAWFIAAAWDVAWNLAKASAGHPGDIQYMIGSSRRSRILSGLGVAATIGYVAWRW